MHYCSLFYPRQMIVPRAMTQLQTGYEVRISSCRVTRMQPRSVNFRFVGQQEVIRAATARVLSQVAKNPYYTHHVPWGLSAMAGYLSCISILMSTATGCPLSLAGSKVHFLTASMAAFANSGFVLASTVG